MDKNYIIEGITNTLKTKKRDTQKKVFIMNIIILKNLV